ncbi:DUF6456 domain-containing protein [Terrihabitans rhizophilus]|uniref:DUF6456 domain-containing protein n=1 Tax=Terrihabitans rhizophilus TaxID=3092662 RepID=A0ABU4RNC9_9HYPH|nr:DUF6456 domain-containing protein [Terrihabitans sp. PJ23]MDX6806333.1 DUF6456 domain-containing protein [Terrihabitans sp. PJ23]
MNTAGKANVDAHPHLAHARARETRAKVGRKRPGEQNERPFEKGFKEVPDPFEAGAVLTVMCNTRESPFEHMVARKHLSPSQVFAGERFRRLYEQAQVSPLRATNPMLEPVDGGQIAAHQPSDRTRQAMRTLEDVGQQLGTRSAALLRVVIGEAVSIDDLARRCPAQSQRAARAYVSGRFREALDDLIAVWGVDAIGSRARKPAVSREVGDLSGAQEWKVDRRGHWQPVPPSTGR